MNNFIYLHNEAFNRLKTLLLIELLKIRVQPKISIIMKKFVSVMIIVVIAATMSLAQELRFGVKGGLNVGKLVLTGDGEKEESEGLISFYLGARAELGLSEKLSVQGELLYQGYGGEFDLGDGDDLTFRLNEISVPLVLKYYLSPQKFSINGGVSLGYILTAKAKYDGDSEDILEFINRTDMGITIGAEYRVTDALFLDFRYNYGISDLWKEDDDITMRASAIQVGAGFRF